MAAGLAASTVAAASAVASSRGSSTRRVPAVPLQPLPLLHLHPRLHTLMLTNAPSGRLWLNEVTLPLPQPLQARLTSLLQRFLRLRLQLRLQMSVPFGRRGMCSRHSSATRSCKTVTKAAVMPRRSRELESQLRQLHRHHRLRVPMGMGTVCRVVPAGCLMPWPAALRRLCWPACERTSTAGAHVHCCARGRSRRWCAPWRIPAASLCPVVQGQ